MKTVQATPKPPYNEWINYIHQNVRNIQIEWPTETKLIKK